MAKTDAERRQKRREIRLMQKESVWLQKAAFALQKAEESQEKLADTRDEEPDPYTLGVNGSDLKLAELEDALQERSTYLLETVREMRDNLY